MCLDLVCQIAQLKLCKDPSASATTHPKRDGQCIQVQTGSKSQVALAIVVVYYMLDL